MSKLVVYEPPYITDDRQPADFADQLRRLVASGQRAEAADLLLRTGWPASRSRPWPSQVAPAQIGPPEAVRMIAATVPAAEHRICRSEIRRFGGSADQFLRVFALRLVWSDG